MMSIKCVWTARSFFRALPYALLRRQLRPYSISYHMHCMSNRLLELSPSLVKSVTVSSASFRRSARRAYLPKMARSEAQVVTRGYKKPHLLGESCVPMQGRNS